MKNSSISLRLTFWFSAIFLSGFIIFGVIMWVDLAYSLSQGRDRTLGRRAERFAEALRETRSDPPSVRQIKLAQLADAIPEGNLIQVFRQDGARVFPQKPSPSDFPWPRITALSAVQYSNLDAGGRPFRLLKLPAPGDPLSLILVAGQLEDNHRLMARFTLGLAAAIPAMLALSALGGYLLSRRVLEPVDQITAALHSINIGNLSRRLPISKTRDELQRLAGTCNEMLGRLQNAVDRINRFTADASHELRSPVALIRGVAEFSLRNPSISSESREAFSEILEESVEAGLLLEDMLTLARADAGYGSEVFEPVELTAVMEDACARLRPLAEAKDQSISIRSSGTAWTMGDRSSLRRLLSILLDNAIKYTPAQGSIEVALTRTATQVSVTVTDTGIGIPQDLQPWIFDRFARVDPSRGEVSGAGLGLAIAKWIAEIHDAELTVQSREREGSSFGVEFHLAEPAAVESTPLRHQG